MMKIFVTLGSQKFQFNRLLKTIDNLIKDEQLKMEVFAQIGYSDYLPQNFHYRDFLDRNQFGEQMDNADIVITHGGTGAIIGAVKRGKKVIAVPRLLQYKEHVDDHQIQIVKQFEDMHFVCPCYDLTKLKDAMEKVQITVYEKYHSNTMTIVNNIEEFLEEL